MNLKLNGKPAEWDVETGTITDLLVMMGWDIEGKGIAVAVNWSVIPRGEWASHVLAENDEVEVITARQGG